MSYYVRPNTININNGTYSGACYAFGASGGFTVQQGFDEIKLRIPDVLQQYDVTDAVQVKYSSRNLNTKLTILKDASNIRVVEAWYDNLHDRLITDQIKICACDYVDGIDTQSIISVGKLANLYADFKYTVGAYFGDPGGFASLFAGDNDFDINNGGIFDASAYIQVVNSATFNMNGSFVSDLSGHVTINDINKTLEWAVDSNVFRNRNPADKNYGVIDGFIAGDLIFIPEGFTITLSLNIEGETLLPINNVGPSFLNAIRNKLNYERGYVKRRTTWSTTNITQTTTVPILMVLTDETLENYRNFGKTWTKVTNVTSSGDPIGNEKWLAVSLSTNGRYQSAITESGNVYVSNTYGTTRDVVFNIGESTGNSIAVSFTGMHQTISNGHGIFVSEDYGQTWTKTYSDGTSTIFVSISLNGQYQTMVSCGDNVYISNDYGVTWRKPLDENSDLYQSIEAFPTAGIALSYNGMYQTIVTEHIYISGDYGQSWKNVGSENEFDDRNWQSIAMSSDGKFQSAIENGGDIYVSNDFGNTWVFVNDYSVMDKTWSHISISATGQYQTALEQNGNIYTSIDYGITWSMVTDSTVAQKNWQWVSISSDGLYQTAVEYDGSIYMSTVLGDIQQHAPCICD